MISLSGLLATHLSETSAHDIPPSAIAAAKLFLIDTLAVAWAGSDQPGCMEVQRVFLAEGGRPESTCWVSGDRLPASGAAFVNATMAAALDYDTLGRDVPVHVSISVIPAALAVAEAVGASGRELAAALVLSADIQYRLAVASYLPHRGWSYTGVFGVFGAAAAAARLLRLNAIQTRHAFGLAYLQSAGNQQANIEPTLAKRLLSSFAVRAGIQAALLAQAGITAPRDIFEGDFGFHVLYQPGSTDRVLDGLGERFDGSDQSLKKYPSCGCNHTSIEATIGLVIENDLKPSEVQALRVRISPYIDRIVGMSYDPSGDAQVAAQFSLRYSLACALVRRRLGLAEIQVDAARDRAILAEVPKVQITVDSNLTGDRGPIEISIDTARGTFERRLQYVPGSLEAPLSEQEVRAKLNECFSRGERPLGVGVAAGLIQCVQALETLPRVADLIGVMSA